MAAAMQSAAMVRRVMPMVVVVARTSRVGVGVHVANVDAVGLIVVAIALYGKS